MLQHVAHETRPADVDAVLAFWVLLGFGAVEPPASLRGRTHWLERRGTHIHLLVTDDPVVPPSGHAAVVAEDFEATIAALRAAGHPVDPRRAHWGAARAFVTDPSGHRVEVMSAPPSG